MTEQNGKRNGHTYVKLTRLEKARLELAKAEAAEQRRRERVELAEHYRGLAIVENRPLGKRWQRILASNERLKVKEERLARQADAEDN